MDSTWLFPTTIWSDNFDINNKKLSDYALKLRSQNAGVVLHELDGWRTTGKDVLDCNVFDELKESINTRLIDIKKQIGFSEYSNFILESSWIYITNQGGWHPPHTHSEGVISCAYYIDVPEDSNSAFAFNDPRKQNTWNSLPEHTDNESLVTMGRYYTYPKTGDFIAFPSWLEHFVSPSMSDKDRIMVALNYKLVRNGSD